MTRTEKLEWLAMNCHKRTNDYPFIGVSINHHDAIIYWPADTLRDSTFTHQEWLSMREKLQNKPSWSAAPRWAKFLAQSPTGSWEWYSGKPIAGDEFWMHVDAGIHGETENHGGKVLGDWRCTLEARPEVIINNQTSATITATQTGGSEITITAQGNSWHERGEFPPAGCECEMLCDMRCGEVFIVGVSRGGNVVIEDEIGAIMEAINCKFRPLRTEREKAIDEMAAAITDDRIPPLYVHKNASKLYDAGYRKEQVK